MREKIIEEIKKLESAPKIIRNIFHLGRGCAGSDEQKIVHFPLLRNNFHETLPFLL